MAESETLPVIRILLVEDNSGDAFMVSSLLGESEAAQYSTYQVRSQAEAVQALAESSFDVCLLDLFLPDAEGFSALIAIQEKAPELSVLILSGMSDMSIAKKAVARGAQDYLLKDELRAAPLIRAIDYALERKQIEKELLQRANYDLLTGLVNRNLFRNRLGMALARAERTDANVALLYIDLDRFKPINDRHGHEAGDETLKSVSRRIKNVLRAYDTAARIGGDEFAVLLENIDTPRDAAVIAQKILQALNPPIYFHGEALEVGASIGIAFSHGRTAQEKLLQQADAAMYQAKKEGNSFRFYTADLNDEAAGRLQWEEDLRGAIASGELQLRYQPYVTPESGAILGVEALLRWLHPKRGLLPPAEFLAMAEKSRLMPALGAWMLTTLRRDIAGWNAQAIPALQIAVNVSSSQLHAPDFMAELSRLARREALGPHRLVLEIAEDAVLTLKQPLPPALVALCRQGVMLHLDHFGRGPISLQSLHAFPFSMLKMDLDLVQRMDGREESAAIIRAAIGLAHQLGRKAGAVGVETAWQMQALKNRHCDMVQGFLIGHPMHAEQLTQWLLEKRAQPLSA